jgi:perosamine synthetase
MTSEEQAAPRKLPVSAPDLSGNEEAYVLDAVRSSWISSIGPYIERFERDFAALSGTRVAIPVANGTMALHVALLALDLQPEDEVIVPALTYIATANAVRYVGAEPVFVDVDPATWCIDPAAIEAAVTPRTRGIIAVHLYGHPADMDAIRAVAERHGLWIVEDAAEAHGARYKDHPVGGLGTIGTFSFYGNKIVTSGEGGAVTLDDPALEARVRLLRGQGMDPARRYFFTTVGYNYRLTNVACAILCAQLERLDSILAWRRELFSAYRAALAGIPGLAFQPVSAWAEPAPWLFCLTIDDAAYGHSRDALMAILDEEGIETRPFFRAIHRLPPYVGRPGALTDLPVTDALAASGLNLPTGFGTSAADVRRVADVIRRNAR